MSAGAIIIAIGNQAQREATTCIESIRRVAYGLTILQLRETVPGYTTMQASRWTKCNLDTLSPFDETMYLDADTRAQNDIQAAFDILADGFDLVITPSQNQGTDVLWHVASDERKATIDEIGYTPLQLQAGVFLFRKNESTRRLFEAWRAEWLRWQDQDQAALLRALRVVPVKTWLLGRPWNGGAVIAHNFGRVRN